MDEEIWDKTMVDLSKLKDGGKWLGEGRSVLQFCINRGDRLLWDSEEIVDIKLPDLREFVSRVMTVAAKEYRGHVLNDLELKGLWHCLLESGFFCGPTYELLMDPDTKSHKMMFKCFTDLAVESAAIAIMEGDRAGIFSKKLTYQGFLRRN